LGFDVAREFGPHLLERASLEFGKFVNKHISTSDSEQSYWNKYPGRLQAALLRAENQHFTNLVKSGRFDKRPFSMPRRKKGERKAPSRLSPISVMRLQVTPVTRHTFRFSATAAQGALTPVSVTNLIGICGGIGTITNSTINHIASSFRVHRVTITAPAAAAADTTARITWGSSNQTPDIEWVDSTVGSAFPLRVSSVPPKLSDARLWYSSINAATAVFNLAYPVNAIVDVDIEYTQLNNMALFATAGVTTVVLGNIYYLPLDGVASHNLVAVGLPTTF